MNICVNTDFKENLNTARVDNHYYQNDGYLSASYSFSPSNLIYFNVGYDARMSWLSADLKHFSGVRRLDQKGVVDVRLEWQGIRADASLLYQHYKDHTKLKTGAADPISKFTPAVNIGYFWHGLSFRAWFKKIFRVPTLNDLYYTQAGNRNLKPEYTRQWNIGAEYNYSNGEWRTQIQADAYINHIDNRIVCLPLRGTYTWTMMNYGKTYCRGLNSTLSGQYATENWSFSLLGSVTLQHDVNRTNSEDKDTYNMPICYSPKFSCGITGIVMWKNLSLTLSDLHVSKRICHMPTPMTSLNRMTMST